MSDSYEHNPHDHEDPMGGPTWLVGFVGMIILIVIVLAVTAVLKFTTIETEDQTLIKQNLAELLQNQHRDDQRLNGPTRLVEYIDEEENTANRLVIPIDDAIEKIANEWGQAQPQAKASN